MMLRLSRLVLISILCAAALLAVPAALCQADFTEVVTFGDSLTHNDILGIVYGNPQDMYGMDPMHAVFAKGSASGDELTNYAVAGSESSNVSLQIDLYEFMRLIFLQGKATLFNFEIGGNDVLNNENLLKAYAPGQNPSADAVIDNIVANMWRDLQRLGRSHTNARFVIWTIPDVTMTPELYNSLTPTEVENLRGHLKRVNLKIRQADKFPFVVVLDLYSLTQKVVANPPVLFGRQLVPPPAYGDYDHLFADTIHPTAVTNAMMANGIIQLINSKWSDNIPTYSNEELADLAHIPH